MEKYTPIIRMTIADVTIDYTVNPADVEITTEFEEAQEAGFDWLRRYYGMETDDQGRQLLQIVMMETLVEKADDPADLAEREYLLTQQAIHRISTKYRLTHPLD